MAKPYGEKTHTQEVIAVYVTSKEKDDIRKCAGEVGMSKYLLDLHKQYEKKYSSAGVHKPR